MHVCQQIQEGMTMSVMVLTNIWVEIKQHFVEISKHPHNFQEIMLVSKIMLFSTITFENNAISWKLWTLENNNTPNAGSVTLSHIVENHIISWN